MWKVWTQESFEKVEFDRPGERSPEYRKISIKFGQSQLVMKSYKEDLIQLETDIYGNE